MAGLVNAATAPVGAALAPLREELLLHPAPRAHDGSPAWTLEDPGRGQFFQIGWAEAEMLSRWPLQSPQRIAEAIERDTALRVDAADVEALARFLDTQSLLQQRGPQACARLQREARTRQARHWLLWVMHHYLFFRIPLVRPDLFLARTLPWVRKLFFTRAFALASAAAGLLGLWLAARQWDRFVHTFLHFFTLEGAAMAALALGITKVLHELGHAYAAKHHGCRVATMGVAFMVMWPVLYTDTSGAWRLASRRQRLSIGAAGMLTETALAAWATLAWSFLPDGVLRSTAFTLATTTWLLTLAVNLNPFMRFDGYFLLSDLLNVPNLQNRAFALARWRLREWLFGWGDPVPEVFAPWRARVLTAYAFGVWVYRFFLFLGIALLVYHLAFKLLGIVLFAIEIVFFILRPIYTELQAWRVRLSDGARWSRRSLASATFLALLILISALPWRTQVQAPAMARAAEQVHLVAPVGARLAQVLVQPGQSVAAGTPLFELDAPDLEHERQSVRRRIERLAWQQSFQAMRRDTAAATPVAQQEWRAALERLAELERQHAQLTMVAAFNAIVADRADPLAAGEWVGAGEWLATLAAPGPARIEAYVAESDLRRVRLGDGARFLPEDPARPALRLRVIEIASTATRRLAAVPELASGNGGAIAALRTPASARPEPETDANGQWVPEQAIYRVLLQAESHGSIAPALGQALRGTVVIDGEAESLLLKAWRQAASIVVREAGF